MNITYYGHSCFMAEIKGKKILFDPFISGNELAKSVNLAQIEADYILISHGHADHIADAVTIAQACNATVVSSWEIATWLHAQGVEKYHPMNTGGKWQFEFGTVKCVTAQHSSGLPDGSYGGNPMGFVCISDEGNFYYAGDTALTLDMQLIPAIAKLDFAILPIGDNFTMDAAEAVQASRMVQCNRVLGVHYDTFGFIKIDHEKAQALFAEAGITLDLMQIGETKSF